MYLINIRSNTERYEIFQQSVPLAISNLFVLIEFVSSLTFVITFT